MIDLLCCCFHLLELSKKHQLEGLNMDHSTITFVPLLIQESFALVVQLLLVVVDAVQARRRAEHEERRFQVCFFHEQLC